MSDFIAIIRDKAGNGVRADRVDGWHLSAVGVRVHLSGGGSVDLRGITRQEFAERLDRALTAQMEAD
ncbi:MAG TPA: hypothetical protein VFJ19_10020 [Nocardioidaceae bacterium]|nr:hypothetical protein [Nocardioidaceae bacterium]